MRTAPAPLAALLLVTAGLAHSGVHAAVFRPLPDLPGGDTRTMVWGLSRDGSTAVGSAIDSRGLVAAYWNDSGVHAIDNDASGARPFAAFAASEDGSTIVGGMGPGIRAFTWTTQPGPFGFRTRRLPELPGTTFLNSRAQDIDASGRYAVGYSHSPESTSANPRIQAVMWDLHAASPAAFGLGYVDPVSLPSSNAVSISGDGAKIVGDGRGIGSIVPFEQTALAEVSPRSASPPAAPPTPSPRPITTARSSSAASPIAASSSPAKSSCSTPSARIGPPAPPPFPMTAPSSSAPRKPSPSTSRSRSCGMPRATSAASMTS